MSRRILTRRRLMWPDVVLPVILGSIQHIFFQFFILEFFLILLFTMNDWPEDDFRLFIGNIGRYCSDEKLASCFSQYASSTWSPSMIRYKSFNKAKVIQNKANGRTKGYGFVSFSDPIEAIKAMREQQGMNSLFSRWVRSFLWWQTNDDQKGKVAESFRRRDIL